MSRLPFRRCDTRVFVPRVNGMIQCSGNGVWSFGGKRLCRTCMNAIGKVDRGSLVNAGMKWGNGGVSRA